MTGRAPRKRYWNEPRMGLRERIYIIEVVRGLRITGGVFFGNMWKWMTGRKGALTTYYPEERRSDYSRCIFCGFCVEACPEDAIRMVKDVPDLPGFDRTAMWGKMDLLLHWHPITNPRKPYPPAPPRGEAP